MPLGGRAPARRAATTLTTPLQSETTRPDPLSRSRASVYQKTCSRASTRKFCPKRGPRKNHEKGPNIVFLDRRGPRKNHEKVTSKNATGNEKSSERNSQKLRPINTLIHPGQGPPPCLVGDQAEATRPEGRVSRELPRTIRPHLNDPNRNSKKSLRLRKHPLKPNLWTREPPVLCGFYSVSEAPHGSGNPPEYVATTRV